MKDGDLCVNNCLDQPKWSQKFALGQENTGAYL